MVRQRKVQQQKAKLPGKPDRPNSADKSESNRSAERRSGEGSDSALARMKRVERDRQWAKPKNGGNGD